MINLTLHQPTDRHILHLCSHIFHNPIREIIIYSKEKITYIKDLIDLGTPILSIYGE